jgi:hypothetical protein
MALVTLAIITIIAALTTGLLIVNYDEGEIKKENDL